MFEHDDILLTTEAPLLFYLPILCMCDVDILHICAGDDKSHIYNSVRSRMFEHDDTLLTSYRGSTVVVPIYIMYISIYVCVC